MIREQDVKQHCPGVYITYTIKSSMVPLRIQNFWDRCGRTPISQPASKPTTQPTQTTNQQELWNIMDV